MNRLIGHHKILKLNFLYKIRYYIAGISLASNPGFPFQALAHSSDHPYQGEQSSKQSHLLSVNLNKYTAS